MKLATFLTSAREARARGAGNLLSQAFDVMRLRFGSGRLGLAEYYDYRLWDTAMVAPKERHRFAGYRAQLAIEELLIDSYSKFMSLDKLTFDALMRAHQLPVPRLLAVFNEGGRCAGEATVLRTAAALADHLRKGMTYPAYCKPSFGGYGRGNLAIRGYVPQSDALTANGDVWPVDQFVSGLEDRARLGILFQELLAPHREIAAVCGERVSGVRVHVLLSRDRPKVHRAIWKIATGPNVIDNFQHGGSGNMLGAVDRETGIVTRVVSGVGSRMRIDNPHPDTGRELTGFRLPRWREVVALVTRAATVFPGFLAQGWDVAICDGGPVLMEVNMLGDLDLSQYAHATGFMDDEFMGFLAEIGVNGLPRAGAGGRSARHAHWRY